MPKCSKLPEVVRLLKKKKFSKISKFSKQFQCLLDVNANFWKLAKFCKVSKVAKMFQSWIFFKVWYYSIFIQKASIAIVHPKSIGRCGNLHPLKLFRNYIRVQISTHSNTAQCVIKVYYAGPIMRLPCNNPSKLECCWNGTALRELDWNLNERRNSEEFIHRLDERK